MYTVDMPTPFIEVLSFALGGLVIGSLATALLLRAPLRRTSETQLEQLKDRFVGIASHYLLTPMTGLQAGLDLLYQSHNLDIAGRERLYSALKRSETRLSLTLQQILLTNQLASGPLVMNLKPSSLAAVASSALTALDPIARQRSVTLQVVDQSQGLQIRIDSRYARQAVTAVLENAIKFSPENAAVTMEVGSLPDQGYVCVSDSGPGMSSAIAAQAAHKFFRGTDLYQFDYEGIGLGLYVTKAIMGAHNGTISIESSPGSGTKVTLRFPNE